MLCACSRFALECAWIDARRQFSACKRVAPRKSKNDSTSLAQAHSAPSRSTRSKPADSMCGRNKYVSLVCVMPRRLLSALVGHALGERDGGDATRLRHHDAAVAACASCRREELKVRNSYEEENEFLSNMFKWGRGFNLVRAFVLVFCATCSMRG
eukprot:2327479-Pleurochrysis_carterae.AAC.1